MNSRRFPAVENGSKSNTYPASKDPYSFAPNFKAKQRLPQSSDGIVGGDSTGESF